MKLYWAAGCLWVACANIKWALSADPMFGDTWWARAIDVAIAGFFVFASWRAVRQPVSWTDPFASPAPLSDQNNRSGR